MQPDASFVAKDGTVYRVKMSSRRYKLFQRMPHCACCGLVGKYFLLQTSGDNSSPHFNLYGFNTQGREIMLTCDHIAPRAKGGKNEQDNYQTLCTRCNSAKKDDDLTLEELRARLGIRVDSTAAL